MAWLSGASAPPSLGYSWDDAAAALSASSAWYPGAAETGSLGKLTQLGKLEGFGDGDLGDEFAQNNVCPSTSRLARSNRVFTYSVPKTCGLMMVCAGSPRAASTAHCMIAENVMNQVLGMLHEKQLSKHDKAQYTGYWNYHLHTACNGDVDNCQLFTGKTGDPFEFAEHIESMDFMDLETKKLTTDAMAEVKTSLEQLHSADIDEESVVVVKTHEFDAELMNACAKRLVLTSWRDKEEVFDSGLELGWFSKPKEASRPVFDHAYDMWSGWRRCWSSAVDADPFHTREHDLGFDALASEDSFREEITKLTKIMMHVLNIPSEGVLDVDQIVDQAVKDDFHQELNPTMTNGNLPGGEEKGEEKGEAGEGSSDASDASADAKTETQSRETNSEPSTSEASETSETRSVGQETNESIVTEFQEKFETENDDVGNLRLRDAVAMEAVPTVVDELGAREGVDLVDRETPQRDFETDLKTLISSNYEPEGIVDGWESGASGFEGVDYTMEE